MKDEQKQSGLNFAEIYSKPVVVEVPEKPAPVEETAPAPKRRGRPPKPKDEEPSGMVIEQNTNGNLFCTNTPYMNSYKDTMQQYDYVAAQANQMTSELKTAFDTLKKSTMVKNKYMHMTELAAGINSAMGTTLQCIREKSKIITDCHNLEMKRSQAQKAAEAAVPDNKYISDLYQAYINMPTNQQVPGNPITMTSTNAINNPEYQFIPSSEDVGYDEFHNNITPEQNRMILGDSPNIETVVFLDESTEHMWFAIIDNLTGQLVPNYPLPDPMMLQGVSVNKMSMSVSNSNFGESWRLIISNNHDSEF